MTSSKKSIVNKVSIPCLDHVMVFFGAPNIESLKNLNHHTYQFFMEGVKGLSCPYIWPLLEASNLIAGIGVTTQTAYRFDFLSWLEWVLEEREKVHPLLTDQVITASHEAIVNGMMWSNLELDSQQCNVRPLDYAQHIHNRLTQVDLAQRYIILSIFKENAKLEVRVTVEGKPIVWQANSPEQFRGTAIIRELVDHVYFDHNDQTICLVFNIY